jgi:hypothetical protein
VVERSFRKSGRRGCVAVGYTRNRLYNVYSFTYPSLAPSLHNRVDPARDVICVVGELRMSLSISNGKIRAPIAEGVSFNKSIEWLKEFKDVYYNDCTINIF